MTRTPAEEVELLSRGMRHWDSDGVILEDAAQLGEMVIKVSRGQHGGRGGGVGGPRRAR